MKILFPLALKLALLALLLSACAPATPTTGPVVLSIHASSAAGPWLSKAFTCAKGQGMALSVSNDPATADLLLRVGEPASLIHPAFQIDTEELLIVTHRESPVQNLTLEQARDLFAGRGDPSVQVWVYSSGDEIQRAFHALVMEGEAVTSLARLATSPQEMSDTLNAERNAVGILPRHWKAGSPRDIFSAGTVPVLAITAAEPSGPLALLIDCLQK